MATTFYDLGDVNRVSVVVTDSTGIPANAGAVVLTVTAPDGTTSTPAVSNPSTGNYQADITITQYGHWGLSWVATGANASAFTDSFNAQAWTSLVSLAEIKTHLGITSTTNDEELRGFAVDATAAVESYTYRHWVKGAGQTVLISGGTGPAILLPIDTASVTTVVEQGVTLTSGTDYVFDPKGSVLQRIWSPFYGRYWYPGTLNISVTYVTGGATVPSDVRRGALELIRHLWETQRGGQTPILGAGGVTEWDPRSAYSMPMRVKELLDPHVLSGFA